MNEVPMTMDVLRQMVNQTLDGLDECSTFQAHCAVRDVQTRGDRERSVWRGYGVELVRQRVRQIADGLSLRMIYDAGTEFQLIEMLESVCRSALGNTSLDGMPVVVVQGVEEGVIRVGRLVKMLKESSPHRKLVLPVKEAGDHKPEWFDPL